jgi:hypothetical protein
VPEVEPEDQQMHIVGCADTVPADLVLSCYGGPEVHGKPTQRFAHFASLAVNYVVQVLFFLLVCNLQELAKMMLQLSPQVVVFGMDRRVI